MQPETLAEVLHAPEPISVLALDSVFDPARRRSLTVSPGSSLADMAAEAYPSLPARRMDILVVTINGHTVPQELWATTRPKPGTIALFKPVPGNDLLRTVLTIAVSVAAIAAGQFYAPILAGSLGFAAGSVGASLTAAAVAGTVPVSGTMLVDALD